MLSLEELATSFPHSLLPHSGKTNMSGVFPFPSKSSSNGMNVPSSQQARDVQLEESPLQVAEVSDALRRLRVRMYLGEEELLDILDTLVRNTTNTEQILEVLAMLPESQGGLFRIAMLLYHGNPAIRLQCVILLQQLRSNKVKSPNPTLLRCFIHSLVSLLLLLMGCSQLQLGQECVRKMNSFMEIGFLREEAELTAFGALPS